jgi:hypothetical protein
MFFQREQFSKSSNFLFTTPAVCAIHFCPPSERHGAQWSKTMDNIIATQELQVERKHFFIEYRENERGRFLKIVEEAHGRRNTIIIPSTGLEEFTSAIGSVLSAADKTAAV